MMITTTASEVKVDFIQANCALHGCNQDLYEQERHSTMCDSVNSSEEVRFSRGKKEANLKLPSTVIIILCFAPFLFVVVTSFSDVASRSCGILCHSSSSLRRHAHGLSRSGQRRYHSTQHEFSWLHFSTLEDIVDDDQHQQQKGDLGISQSSKSSRRRNRSHSSRTNSSPSSSIVLYKNGVVGDDDSSYIPLHNSSNDNKSNSNNLPPWLVPTGAQSTTRGRNASARRRQTSRDSGERSVEIQIQIQLLEYSLLEHGFSGHDSGDIIRGILMLASNDETRILGCIEFCKLIVQLEKDTMAQLPSTSSKQKQQGQLQKQLHDQEEDEKSSDLLFVTKDVLLASIYHFMECFSARQNGIYDKVRQSMHIGEMAQHEDDDACGDNDDDILLSDEDHGNGPTSPLARLGTRRSGNTGSDVALHNNLVLVSSLSESQVHTKQTLNLLDGRNERSSSTSDLRELFTGDVIRLAQSASRIKRAEIISDVMFLSSGRRGALSNDEYTKLREMLLSLMEDWRALAIRCVASLFRLERTIQKQQQQYQLYTNYYTDFNNDSTKGGPGYYHQQQQYFGGIRSPDTVRAARGAMRIYANLAQRLGMHRLKSELESRAFMVLYPRQYSAVSILFHQDGDSMRAVSSYLTAKVKDLLSRDSSLLSQLDAIEVTSRVKEPYSFWKKLLRKRRARNRENKQNSLLSSTSSELSTMEVLDAIALRVIFKAQKWTPDESDSETRSRERLICYYIQHLLALGLGGAATNYKDYILNRKPNGYQSLHFTSIIAFNGEEYPFEVQVRSDEMHRAAEFGVAAHWDYKLENKALPPSSPNRSDRLLSPANTDCNDGTPSKSALDSATNATQQTAETDGDTPYIDALVTARQSLVRSSVYVFLAGSSFEEGKLLSLPAKSQICDLVVELELQDGSQIVEDDLTVLKNGKISSFDDDLANGDVVLLFRSSDRLQQTDPL